MITKLVKSLIISSAMISMPLVASANLQSSVVNAPDYETLVGNASKYAFPNGQKISVYPSLKIGVPLASGDYTFASTKEKPMFAGDNKTTYVLKATSSGQDKINQALSKMPAGYVLSDSSQTIMGQFTDNSSKKNQLKYFNTGITVNNSKSDPDVTDVMFIATLTDTKQVVNSQKELSSVKNDTAKTQSTLQDQIGKLSPAQLKIVNPSAATLTVKSKDINTNTDPKTAQSQSKTKIVNLDALKQAQAADKIEKQQASIKHKHKLIKIALISVSVAIAAIISAIVVYVFKNKKSS